MADYPLGRIEPTDFSHVEKYPMRALVTAPALTVEKTLRFPSRMRRILNQPDGSCVGYSLTWMQIILNDPDVGPARYMPHALYRQAQKIDEWEGDDYEGTSVRAGCDVLRNEGHTRWDKNHQDSIDYWQPEQALGIEHNRWAVDVDEIRTAIALGIPPVFGINWYDTFFDPEQVGTQHYIGRGTQWGRVVGGHAICCYGASDYKQAFKLINTWGPNWPLVWLPYEAMRRLMGESGEAVVVSDR